jgi:hypothetical protein
MEQTDSTAAPEEAPSKWATGAALVFYIAVMKLLLHLIVQNYGYFRDELYFLACANHLAWGYMDQPPFSVLMTWLSLVLFGPSLVGIHVLPALAGAVQVLLAGMLVREFGGKSYAQVMAAIATAVAPIYLAMDAYLSMNCFEPVLWTLMAYLLVRIINTGNQKLWLWFGVVAGIGLENKYGIAVFAFSIVVGVLLTTERKALLKAWIWIGGAIAALIFLPNLLWQYQHGFPFLAMQKQFLQGKNVILTPIEFLKQQVLLLNPAACPLWIAGLCFFFTKAGKKWRALGWTFLVALLVFLSQKGTKNYFLSPAYIMLFASGAVLLEQAIGSLEKERRSLMWLRAACIIIVLAGGAALAPLSICILSPQQFIAYMDFIRIKPPMTEHHKQSPLPQQYADMFGWPELTDKVAVYYNSLSDEDKAKTAIFGANYGDCGAIDFFGPKYGLPRSIGNHMNYWVWGPRGYTGESMIILGGTEEDLSRKFQSVVKVAETYHPYAMPYENKSIWHCRGGKLDLKKEWNSLRSY